MKKKYNKELMDKIKSDLDERLASFQDIDLSSSNMNNTPNSDIITPVAHIKNSNHSANDLNLNDIDYDDTSLIFELDNTNEIISKKSTDSLTTKKRKNKMSFPIIIFITFSVLILAYIYKMNHDLKKKIAIENELKIQDINYEIKDNQYKDVKDDFFDDELQEIDTKKNMKTKKTP